MNFRREGIRDLYIGDTCVENIFIMEYMPEAEGLFVKIYLTALMFAGNEEMSNERLARHLNVTEEDVLRAWNYWEEKNVIRKHYIREDDRFHYVVEFLSLKERIYSPQLAASGGAEETAYGEKMDDKLVRRVFGEIQEITGRMLEGREPESIVSWIYDNGIDPELIIFVYRYCVQQRRNSHFRYIESVLKQWLDEGIDSVEKAAEYQEETDQRFINRKRVMQALGFTRNPTESEAEKIDQWFEEMGFSMEKVLDACAKTSGISNPNINYVNAVLTRWHKGSGITNTQTAGGSAEKESADKKNAVMLAKKSYDEARNRNRNEQEKRIEEIRIRLPEIAGIEDRLRECSLRLTRAALRGGSSEEIRQQISSLIEKKGRILKENGYPEDYMELRYDCPECKDTGVLENGGRCRCFAEKLRKYSL